MSVNYANGLSEYPNKGKCGMPEYLDQKETFEENSKKLVALMKSAKRIVFHTGAGISTACGIPDFRGPNGVWTHEAKGSLPEFNLKFEEALPSLTHRALVALEKQGYVHHLITQNVDGLHFRFGFPRNRLSILHGDMFIRSCSKCNSFLYSKNSVPTIGLKETKEKCPIKKSASRTCGGVLRDTILDWEDKLPDPDHELARIKSQEADLHICLGTSLQIFPAAEFPLGCRKRPKPGQSSPLVIVNLQKTKLDQFCTVRFFSKVDEVMEAICSQLDVSIPTQLSQPCYVLRSSFDADLPWKIHSLHTPYLNKLQKSFSEGILFKNNRDKNNSLLKQLINICGALSIIK